MLMMKTIRLRPPTALLLSIFRGSSTLAGAFTLGSGSRSFAGSILPSSFAAVTTSRNLRGGSSSSLSAESAERPFQTWSFDDACETMEWTPIPGVELSALTAESSDSIDDADLVIVGVLAPPEEEKDEDDSGEKEEEKEMDPIALTGTAKNLDESVLGGVLSELAADNSKAFQNGASAGSMTPPVRVAAAAGSGTTTKRYILLGLGRDKDDGDLELESVMRKAGAAVASACDEQKKIASCNILLPSQITEQSLQDFSTAFYSGLHSDNRYRTGKKVEVKAEDVKTVRIFMEKDNTDTAVASSAIATGQQLAMGVSLTKDVVNAPHNILNSISLADTARRIAAESNGSITCEILGKEECEKRGMGAYLGVARGSETEPQFIHLTYKPLSGDIK